jgi:hypothetical protein
MIRNYNRDNVLDIVYWLGGIEQACKYMRCSYNACIDIIDGVMLATNGGYYMPTKRVECSPEMSDVIAVSNSYLRKILITSMEDEDFLQSAIIASINDYDGRIPTKKEFIENTCIRFNLFKFVEDKRNAIFGTAKTEAFR